MTRLDYWMVGLALIAMFGGFSFLKIWPNIDSLTRLVDMINTKGGNIILLMWLSVYFYHDTMAAYWSVVELIKGGTIASDNGIALNALTFSSTAFGAVSGALLKVMSGEESKPPVGMSDMTRTTRSTLPVETTPPTDPAPPKKVAIPVAPQILK